MPQSQDAQRDRPVAERPPRLGRCRAAGRMETGRREREGHQRAVRLLGHGKAPGCGGKPVRRPQQVRHRERPRPVPGVGSVSGHDRYQLAADTLAGTATRPGHTLVGRVYGSPLPLGRPLDHGGRVVIPNSHGILRSLDAQGLRRRTLRSPSHATGGPAVACTH